MSKDRVILKVVVHDDGKHHHVRPLTTTLDEGAEYQCNQFERIVNLVELKTNESIRQDYKEKDNGVV